jgi:hypothetical protein
LPVGTSDTAPLDYGTMRAVAVRIDPCFANVGPITDPDTCANQLRIVFQSLVINQQNGATQASDHAVHAFYSLTRDQLVELVGQMTQLRIDQGQTADMGPLAVHPLLVSQGLQGAFASVLNTLIVQYAGQQNLTRFTQFFSPHDFPEWNFRGFDVAPDGTTTPNQIASLGSATEDTFVNLGGMNLGQQASELGTTTQPTSADNISLLWDLPTAKQAAQPAQQAAVDSAFRIANPNVHSPNTIDCVSCHLSEPSLLLTASTLGLPTDTNTNGFVADPNFVSAADMQQTAPLQTMKALNLHIFSYRDDGPHIAARVVNETATVVTYLNGTVLASSSSN